MWGLYHCPPGSVWSLPPYQGGPPGRTRKGCEDLFMGCWWVLVARCGSSFGDEIDMLDNVDSSALFWSNQIWRVNAFRFVALLGPFS